MYYSIPLYLLLCETGIILASTHLDYAQRLYPHCLLSLLDQHFTKEIFYISLIIADEIFQLKKLLDNTLIRIQNV